MCAARNYGFQSKIHLSKKGSDGKYRLLEELVYVARTKERFTIPKDFPTDLASIPGVIKWCWGNLDGKYPESFTLHDYLYQYRKTGKARADELLGEALESQGASWLTRASIVSGVSAFGIAAWTIDGQDDVHVPGEGKKMKNRSTFLLTLLIPIFICGCNMSEFISSRLQTKVNTTGSTIYATSLALLQYFGTLNGTETNAIVLSNILSIVPTAYQEYFQAIILAMELAVESDNAGKDIAKPVSLAEIRALRSRASITGEPLGTGRHCFLIDSTKELIAKYKPGLFK